ncbi:hypothetical protein BDN72DRAFT_680217 [Pluteus cervinus]|uniref:Uncharacterized protein n=1 Tax=Pluteus cervinus TaxID=181527 RepID=A0ACD3AR65_9AGAR|nr:hypothetical protein BDN72DRAFT_680217 [Pluteus cervinus]
MYLQTLREAFFESDYAPYYVIITLSVFFPLILSIATSPTTSSSKRRSHRSDDDSLRTRSRPNSRRSSISSRRSSGSRIDGPTAAHPVDQLLSPKPPGHLQSPLRLSLPPASLSEHARVLSPTSATTPIRSIPTSPVPPPRPRLKSVREGQASRPRRSFAKFSSLSPELQLRALSFTPTADVASLLLVSRNIRDLTLMACLPYFPIALTTMERIESFSELLRNNPAYALYVKHIWIGQMSSRPNTPDIPAGEGPPAPNEMPPPSPEVEASAWILAQCTNVSSLACEAQILHRTLYTSMSWQSQQGSTEAPPPSLLHKTCESLTLLPSIRGWERAISALGSTQDPGHVGIGASFLQQITHLRIVSSLNLPLRNAVEDAQQKQESTSRQTQGKGQTKSRDRLKWKFNKSAEPEQPPVVQAQPIAFPRLTHLSLRDPRKTVQIVDKAQSCITDTQMYPQLKLVIVTREITNERGGRVTATVERSSKESRIIIFNMPKLAEMGGGQSEVRLWKDTIWMGELWVQAALAMGEV